MIRIFKYHKWQESINQTQFPHLIFHIVRGHDNHFVVDASDEDADILILLGCEPDNTVSECMSMLGGRCRVLYLQDNEYHIIEISYASITYPK